MMLSRRIPPVAVLAWVCAAASSLADPPVGPRPPLSDPVDRSLLPTWISSLPVTLDASRAFIFREEDGTDAIQFIGDFTLRIGENADQELRSREAIVWIMHRTVEGHAFRQLHVLLWRDASIREIAGTLTTGPLLLVTLNTSGDVHLEVNDVAFRPLEENQAYLRGREIQQALVRESAETPATNDNAMLRIVDPAARIEPPKKETIRRTVQVRSDGKLEMTDIEPGRKVLLITGGVYLSRGAADETRFLEIRADSVVVFLPSQNGGRAPRSVPTEVGALAPRGQDRENLTQPRPPAPRSAIAGMENIEVEAAYLEGDVVLSLGANQVRASRLYYDFVEDRALILDAVVHTTMLERNIPLYLRAAEIRQLSPREYSATDAILTTSEFHTPHYHLGAGRIELTDLTPAEPTERLAGIRSGRFHIQNATLNIGGRPILSWPDIRGNIDTSETAIQSARTGFSDAFGFEIETDWELFGVLGLETPEGFDATLSMDYFSERGPAIGVNADYQRDRYYGTFRTYLLADDGTDFLGRRRTRPSHKDIRGRILLRHRQYLDDDWQLTFETSYITDQSFQEEFFESEFDNDKEQETLLYLKKQRDNTALTIAIQPRIMDFVTQTERLPDIAYYVIGEPRGDGATWYSENRIGIVRYRPADQTLFDILRDGLQRGSGSVVRADTRQEMTWPMDIGAVRVVPFAAARGTVWDDSPRQGGVARLFSTLGVRASMYLSRAYPDIRSTLWDLDGVRHIVKPDLVAWVSTSSRDSRDFFPFDENVEGIDDQSGVAVGLRQRWQTKRGAGDTRRTVDFLTLDVEAAAFNGATGRHRTNGFTSFSRPENSIARNYANASLIYRVNDRTAFLSEINYDLNDGEVDILNISLAVERSPRLSYLLGYRMIDETQSNLLGFDMNYRLSEKHTLALRERFDLDRGQTQDFTVAFIRKFPRWFGALSFALDEAEDDFGISFSLWPEGLPQAALGSRRFTGIPGSTRVRND